MKSYTDIEQSKKLAEILPLDSADMHYSKHSFENYYSPIPHIGNYSSMHDQIPCWSLAALLEILNKTAYFIDEDGSVTLFSYKTVGWDLVIDSSGLGLFTGSNPVDVCYKMMLKLHEQNLL